jgi:hypothetical protein
MAWVKMPLSSSFRLYYLYRKTSLEILMMPEKFMTEIVVRKVIFATKNILYPPQERVLRDESR